MSNLPFDELDDKTIKLMNDAGITPVKHAYSFNAAINRLVAVVRADEREVYAKLCDDIDTPDGWSTANLSASIRARGEK